MSTKKCSKCGWEYPGDWPGRTCKFCHGPIEGGYCSICGEWSDKLHRGKCTKCRTEEHRAWDRMHKLRAEASYREWLLLIKHLRQPYETLTEEQWMNACKHFGGCAYCGAESIDVRSMFIPFKDGGRYCAWNIIPACEKCETAIKTIQNPFLRMDNVLYRAQHTSAQTYNLSLDKLEAITEYLKRRM